MPSACVLFVALLGPARPYDGPQGVAADPALEVPTATADATPPPVHPAAATAHPAPHEREVDRIPVSTGVRREGDDGDDGPPRNWAVGGFVDTGYTYENNLPDNHVDRGNFTSVRVNEFTVHLAAVYLRHTATDDEPWVFELAGQVGPAATALLSAEPRPGGDASRFTGAEVWQHIGRANVGVRIPKVGTEIAAGLFPTAIGIYGFWTKDNPTFSTPWHLNAVPYVLMGGRITQPIGRKVAAQLWITNGWQTYGDVNRVPSAMAGVTYAPNDALVLSQWVYAGAEDVDNRARSWRTLSDSWMIYDVGRWGLSAVFDVGRERLTTLVGEPVALWMGGAFTARGQVLKSRRDRVRWDMAGRAEVFWDRDGRMYGVRQTMLSGVYGNTLTLFDHVLLRVEYRYDHGTNPAGFFYRRDAVNDDDDGLSPSQHSLFFALTGYFEYAFATRRRRRAR